MANKTANIFQFKISLKKIKPKIWRRIQVPADYTFHDLHLSIQKSMGWFNRHLHCFRMKDSTTGSKVEIGSQTESIFGDDEDIVCGKTVQLTRYFLTEKAKAVYEYDFGDGWEHDVVLEKILPAVEGEKYPKCIAGKRACPPEDCGGYDGYENHVEILSNKRHSEYEEHMQWLNDINGPTDVESFDPNEVDFTCLDV